MNPYAASHDIAEPRSWRNFWRLLIAVAVLFILPSLLVFGYLEYERRHPTLFQSYEEWQRDEDVERWKAQRERESSSTLRQVKRDRLHS